MRTHGSCGRSREWACTVLAHDFLPNFESRSSEPHRVSSARREPLKGGSSAEALFASADVDGDGALDYAEFIASTMSEAQAALERNLARAFDHFDEDNSGFITIEEARRVLDEFGSKVRAHSSEEALCARRPSMASPKLLEKLEKTWSSVGPMVDLRGRHEITFSSGDHLADLVEIRSHPCRFVPAPRRLQVALAAKHTRS